MLYCTPIEISCVCYQPSRMWCKSSLTSSTECRVTIPAEYRQRQSSGTVWGHTPSNFFSSEIDGAHFGLFTAATVASVLVLILSLIQYSYVIVYTSNENLRSNMYFVISTPLVTCGTSFLGMIMPRSAAFLYGSTMCYYMVVLQINISLMHSMFGSRQALRRYMNNCSKRIKLAVKPYWCCCTCLPSYVSF